MRKLIVRFLLLNLFLFGTLILVIACTQNRDNESHPLNDRMNSVFNVKRFNAAGDGKVDDTQAIQKTIDACHNNGGGMVYIPQGTFLVGTLVLRDNVTLFISSGGVLLGSSNLKDYRPLNHFSIEIPSQLGNSLNRDVGVLHLIYAENARNVGIMGPGKIDGQGACFWDENYHPLQRPNQMIQFEACQDAIIQDVTLQNSPFWALHLLGCDNVKIQNITIRNPRLGPNTDGIDVNSSSNVLISNCYIDGGDDCICLKARLKDKACENITVSNCILVSNQSGLKLGTHSIGEIRHCVFSNCVLRNTYLGIGIYMKDGGVFEDINFFDLTVDTQNVGNTQRQVFPIVIDLEKRTDQATMGRIRNITFSNININTRGRCLIGGLENQPIEGLVFNNCRLRIPVCDEANGAKKPRGVITVNDPEPGTDYSYIPSHLIFSNVRDLTIRDLRIELEKFDTSNERHAIWGIHLDKVNISGFRATLGTAQKKLAIFYFEQCKNMFITDCQAPSNTKTFIQLIGNETENVSLIGNDLHSANEAFQISADVKPNAFFQSANRLQ